MIGRMRGPIWVKYYRGVAIQIGFFAHSSTERLYSEKKKSEVNW